VPAYALANKSVNIAFSIRNNVTAANLAQEGIEVVRALRDTNWFNQAVFNTGLTTCAAGCRVMWYSTALIPLDVNPVLSIGPNTGAYYYKDIINNPDGVDSIFKRKITITSVSPVELKVESEVTWTERTRNKSIKVESHLFDWK